MKLVLMSLAPLAVSLSCLGEVDAFVPYSTGTALRIRGRWYLLRVRLSEADGGSKKDDFEPLTLNADAGGVVAISWNNKTWRLTRDQGSPIYHFVVFVSVREWKWEGALDMLPRGWTRPYRRQRNGTDLSVASRDT
jgi:hypothetical protein